MSSDKERVLGVDPKSLSKFSMGWKAGSRDGHEIDHGTGVATGILKKHCQPP